MITTTLSSNRLFLAVAALAIGAAIDLSAAEKGDTKRLDLGDGVKLELVHIPPGSFMMGSTAAEKAWATGIEGGAKPGTVRENYEGEPRAMMRRSTSGPSGVLRACTARIFSRPLISGLATVT